MWYKPAALIKNISAFVHYFPFNFIFLNISVWAFEIFTNIYSIFTMLNFKHIYFTFCRLEGQSRLEAIIVFEEFCKEMAAIVFVQHHAVMSRSWAQQT